MRVSELRAWLETMSDDDLVLVGHLKAFHEQPGHRYVKLIPVQGIRRHNEPAYGPHEYRGNFCVIETK